MINDKSPEIVSPELLPLITLVLSAPDDESIDSCFKYSVSIKDANSAAVYEEIPD